MSKPDLVFLTADNNEKVQARIAPHVKEQLAAQAKQESERAALEKRKIDDAIANSRR